MPANSRWDLIQGFKRYCGKYTVGYVSVCHRRFTCYNFITELTNAVLHGYVYFIVLPGINGCVNSCTNSPEDWPVGPKHVEIQQYTNKIVTSVGFHSL